MEPEAATGEESRRGAWRRNRRRSGAIGEELHEKGREEIRMGKEGEGLGLGVAAEKDRGRERKLGGIRTAAAHWPEFISSPSLSSNNRDL